MLALSGCSNTALFCHSDEQSQRYRVYFHFL